MSDLWQRSAIELAGLIRAKEVSSREVIEAHLARIDAVNPTLHAVVRVLADEARAGADEADRRLAAGDDLGPLHGVPFTIKDNIDMVGLASTWGVPALAEARPPLDAPVVERMKAAGAIPLARTNLPDLALRVHTDSSLYGLTRNPWNLARTVAGSSGGEAAALASGMSPIGLGNDIGGSLRNPANACGIASIRPTLGRVPDAAFVPAEDANLAAQLMAVQGPMARRVADVRLGLRILNGAHPRDPWSVTVPLEGPAASPVRVAVLPEPPGGSTDPTIAAVVRRAADALADAGYDVVETGPDRYEEALATWRSFLTNDFRPLLPLLLPLMGADGVRFFEWATADEAELDQAAYAGLFMVRQSIGRSWSLFQSEHPLLLTPTWTQLPFEHGWDVGSPEQAAATIELIRPVLPANLLGLPSACVPAGRDEATGLPIGVLLTGARMRDDLCLDAAEAVEARLGLTTPIDPAS